MLHFRVRLLYAMDISVWCIRFRQTISAQYTLSACSQKFNPSRSLCRTVCGWNVSERTTRTMALRVAAETL